MPVRTLSGNCSTAAGRQTGRMMKIVTTVIGRNVLCESTLGGYTEVSTQNESGDCVISLCFALCNYSCLCLRAQ